MPKCPHCEASFPLVPLFTHGMLLGKSHLGLRCDNCGGRSNLDRSGSASRLGMVILAIAFAGWFLASRILALPQPWTVLVPPLIWAAGTLVAFYIFTFRGTLVAVPSGEAGEVRISGLSLLADYAFLGAMVAWMYFVYRGVTGSMT